MSKLDELEAFIATLDTGSFTKGAKKLRLVKSVVSRRVTELEARLDTQLLHRSTRSLTPTQAGEAIYAQGKRLLDDWAAMENSFAQPEDKLSGTLRIAAPLSYGLLQLSPRLLQFAVQHPEINYDIDLSDRVVDIVMEGFDLALRIGNLKDSSLKAVKLTEFEMHIAASPQYLAKHGTPTDPEQLAKLDELRYSGRKHLSWIFRQTGEKPKMVTLKPRMQASNGEFLNAAAKAGLGVVVQPDFLLAEAIKSGSLVRILPDYHLDRLGLYAVFHASRHTPARVRAFVDFLKADLRAG